MQQPQAGLEIRAGFFPLAFLLFFCKPVVSIDGSAPIQGQWGVNLIPVTPGRHQVTMWYRYFFIKQASKADLVVDVPPGQVAQLTYRPHFLYIVFLPGRLIQVGQRGMQGPAPVAPVAVAPAAQPAAAAPAAAWHPDPMGRHELRYWNGEAWTEDVSDAGVVAKDPVG